MKKVSKKKYLDRKKKIRTGLGENSADVRLLHNNKGVSIKFREEKKCDPRISYCV